MTEDIMKKQIGVFKCEKHNTTFMIYEECPVCELEEFKKQIGKLKEK